jgi:hypothetical protein
MTPGGEAGGRGPHRSAARPARRACCCTTSRRATPGERSLHLLVSCSAKISSAHTTGGISTQAPPLGPPLCAGAYAGGLGHHRRWDILSAFPMAQQIVTVRPRWIHSAPGNTPLPLTFRPSSRPRSLAPHANACGRGWGGWGRAPVGKAIHRGLPNNPARPFLAAAGRFSSSNMLWLIALRPRKNAQGRGAPKMASSVYGGGEMAMRPPNAQTTGSHRLGHVDLWSWVRMVAFHKHQLVASAWPPQGRMGRACRCCLE